MKKALGLGKGLDALFTESKSTEDKNTQTESFVTELDINLIEPSSGQPRKYFDDESLLELAESIKAVGVVQPIIVNKNGEYYTIIAGERRWRACRLAKLTKIPVIIKNYTEMEALQVALIENLQRKDLNPIEEGYCYKRLVEDYFFTHESLAEKIGRHRNHISRAMSLLSLDNRVQEFIINGRLSVSHGLLLLGMESLGFSHEDQFLLCERIIENDLSVRETELYIKGLSNPPKELERPTKESEYKHLENELNTILSTRVLIKKGKSKGKIEIEYYNEDDLDRLICMFKQLG